MAARARHVNGRFAKQVNKLSERGLDGKPRKNRGFDSIDGGLG